MPWIRELSADRCIEIVLDPDFPGSLVSLARSRVTWAVTTAAGGVRFLEADSAARHSDLYELNRCEYPGWEPLAILLDILSVLDDHYPGYDRISVHGLSLEPAVERSLSEEFLFDFRALPGGFEARMDWTRRDSALGR